MRFRKSRWALVVCFSLLVEKKTLLGWLCSFVFGLPLTAPFLPISLGASPFHQICRVQKCRKNAFVRLKLQENGYPIQSKLLTIQVFPYRYPQKQTTHSRSAVILRKTIAKPSRSRRHKQPLPPIMKNERSKPNNPTETRTI